jgi:bifunctional lysine-specific demethylase and histidyl-hydroxylase NO66
MVAISELTFRAIESLTAGAIAAKPAAAITFEDIIAPVDRERFFADYWEQRPLVTRGRPASFFAPLFSAADVDHVICNQRPKPSRIEVVTSQGFVRDNYLNPDGTANINLVYERYLEGSTIILSGLDETWEPLAIFCRKLEGALSHPAGIGIYLTPPGTQGVKPHYDTQEIFVLQVEGRKHWKVYKPLHELPPVEGSYRLVDERKLPPLVCETSLEPGDMLYMPRGFIHEAISGDGPSLHITLEIQVRSWLDFLTDALEAMADRDVALRRSLPVGFLHREEAMSALRTRFGELIDTFHREVQVDDAVGKHVEALAVKKPPPPDGHFAMLFGELDATTRLTKRHTSLVRVFESHGATGIQFSGNQIVGPAKIRDALRFIAETDTFTPDALPGPLNDHEKLVLIRRLIRVGLLRRA